MISCDDIFWTTDDQFPTRRHQVDFKRTRIGGSTNEKRPVKTIPGAVRTRKSPRQKKTPQNSQQNPEVTKNSLVTLKDLSEHDKQKIAQLIKELAKAGEEKENVLHTLEEERRQFVHQVNQMEKEKLTMMGKQELLSEEVKQCQQLLQYYQNLISMQQASLLAQEESKLQNQPVSKIHKSRNSSMQSSESSLSNDAQTPDEIRVAEVTEATEDTQDRDWSEDDITHMSPQRYRNFLHNKKERLKKEQESLRRLLLEAENKSLQESRYSQSTGKDISRFSSPKQRSIQTQINFSPRKIPMPGSRNQTYSPGTIVETSPGIGDRSHTESNPQRILDFLSRNEEPVPTSFQQTSSVNQSFHLCETNLERLNESMSASTTACDDSQILQDIFFVV